MEITTNRPADGSLATMRFLPELRPASTHCRGRLMSLRSGAFAQGRGDAIIAPVMAAAYHMSGAHTDGVWARISRDQVVAVGTGTSADHKFSTRVGPSASPPV